jgi:hypothetical protein
MDINIISLDINIIDIIDINNIIIIDSNIKRSASALLH